MNTVSVSRSDTLKRKQPNELDEEIKLPHDWAPAYVTGRAELLDLIPARPLTAEECGHVKHALKVMINTNRRLYREREELARQTQIILVNLNGMMNKLDGMKKELEGTTVRDDTNECEV